MKNFNMINFTPFAERRRYARERRALLQTKEEPMADLVDGKAFLALGPEFAGFNSNFVTNGRPVFRSGLIGLGSTVGAKGQCGTPDGPQPTIGPFRGFVGVFGTSRNNT